MIAATPYIPPGIATAYALRAARAAACVLPPPSPPAGAPIVQVVEARRWQIAWTFALADGRRAVVHFRTAYCFGR